MSSIEMKGIEDLQRRIKDLSREMKDRGNDYLSEKADRIVQLAKDNCPVDEGTLRDSIHAEKSAIQQGRSDLGQFTSGSDVEIRIVAGGPDIPYAVAVHENPSEHDPPTWKGKQINFKKGGSKFLERPFRDEVNNLSRDVGNAMMKT